ncbi:MAG: GAF domain-containing protein, partial [Chloroflexaceae bacterium]|nr:GAF domain-containing protein [Chloroflexaceae bacterium]
MTLAATDSAHEPDKRINALLRLTSAIETAISLDELLLLALSELATLIDVPYSVIALVEDDEQHISLVNTFPPRVAPPPHIALKDAPYLQQVIQSHQPVQIYDLEHAAVHPEMGRLITDEKLKSLLMIPLITQDRVIGILGLGVLNAPRHFANDEIATIRVLAGPLAAAISAFITTESAQRRSAELATLNDISAAVTSSLDTREVYLQVVRQLNEYFQVDAGSLLMRDENGDLHFVMTLEAGEEKLAGIHVPRGQGVVGHVAETQQYEIVPDAERDPRFYRQVSDAVGYQVKSILCVPMIVKGRTIGVIELLNKKNGPFIPEDAERLSRMAATVGVAIENARLFQQVTTGRDRFEAILNSTNDGILMADMYGTVVTANPTAARVLGVRDKDELIGKSVDALLELLRAQARETNAPAWIGESAANGMLDVVEFELANTQQPYWRHFALPVYDEYHGEIGRMLLFQDISIERELAQLRDDYTGMLVHDLRAPLTAIMNGIMMVQRGLGGPVSQQQRDLLGIAYTSSQTMLEMVNTLLDISKMEQGRLQLDISPISPYGLLDEVLTRLQASAHDNGIELVLRLPAALPPLEADRDKLNRILQNLVDNAIKFSPTGSTIMLSAGHLRATHQQITWLEHPGAEGEGPQTLPALSDDDWMVFWVTDHGSGIPKQYHERIFEKFGQVRGRKTRGTGLGLTFCKLAVESHGGSIWVESEEGQGSTFAFALPLNRTFDI